MLRPADTCSNLCSNLPHRWSTGHHPHASRLPPATLPTRAGSADRSRPAIPHRRT